MDAHREDAWPKLSPQNDQPVIRGRIGGAFEGEKSEAVDEEEVEELMPECLGA